jgi:hypothetical protein
MPISTYKDAADFLDQQRLQGRQGVLFTQDELNERVAAARAEANRQGPAQSAASQIAAAREEGRRAGRAEAETAKANKDAVAKAEKATNYGWNDVVDRLNKAPPSGAIR